MQSMIVKRYSISNFRDSNANILRRIEMINEIGCAGLNSVPFTNAEVQRNEVIVSQDAINFVNEPAPHEGQFLSLAADLEYMNRIGFVHGDINRRNVRATAAGFSILDFEPCLYQIENGKLKTMVTLPYFANQDRLTNRVSPLTDKLGFYYFVRRVTGSFGSADIVRLNKTKDHSEYLGFPEEELSIKSYNDLAQEALNSCRNDPSLKLKIFR